MVEEQKFGHRQRTRSQIGRGSKNKGASYERMLCKVANAVLNVPPLNWEFVRTPRSGGWMKASMDPSLRKLRGDITVPDACPVMLECKRRENWSMDQLTKLGMARWEPFQWYLEAREKADHAKKVAVLVFSKNFAPDQVLIDGGDLSRIASEPTGQVVWVNGYAIMLFEDFLQALHKRVISQEIAGGTT